MPAIIPLLVPILTAAAAGTSAAVGIKSLVSGGPSALQADPNAVSAQATADAQSKAAALNAMRQQNPNTQAALGGAVSPEYYAQIAASLTGNGNNPDWARTASQSAFGASGASPMQGAASPTTNFLAGGNFAPGGGGLNGGQQSGGIPDIQQLLQQLGIGGTA